MEEMAPELELPGFRFHPTEEELLDFYLKNMIFGNKMVSGIIGYLNIYQHDPCELPGFAKIGEREWYFFVPKGRKHGSQGRPNRTTANGFWKATGSDKKIMSLSDPKKIIGLRKTLVFYKGRAPTGCKTDWVMNEYRLPNSQPLPKDMVLCKIYRKATSLKVLEQRAAMEEEKRIIQGSSVSSASPVSNSLDNLSSFRYQQEPQMPPISLEHLDMKREVEDMVVIRDNTKGSSLHLPSGEENLPELQVPKLSVDWMNQDSFWLSSPWLQNLTPFANMLNFLE